MTGAIGTATATVAVAVRVTPAPEAVNVKVVVAATWAAMKVLPVTSPMPWSMERLVAPVVDQASVTAPPPIGNCVALTPKDLITGFAGGGGSAAGPAQAASVSVKARTSRFEVTMR